VNIYEKIFNLKEYQPGSSSGLIPFYKGDLVSAEDTFVRRLVRSEDNFLLMKSAFEAKKWKRYPNIEFNDYTYMHDSLWDANVFIPKQDLYFLGFGQFG
jgi:hypothetical protein